MGENHLKKANKLFSKKKYTQVIRMLEPQVFKYREDFDFYYLLGISCLHTRDFGGAFTYLKRSLSLKPLDEKCLLALAVVHLKRQETQEAIRNWFSVLDNNPKSKAAQRGLKIIKRLGPEKENIIFQQGRYLKIMPPQPKNISLQIMILCGVFLIAISGFTISKMFQEKEIERNVEIDKVGEFSNFLEESGKEVFTLTKKEVIDLYNKAYSYFNQGKDNIARRTANIILLSNASEKIKINAQIIVDNAVTPNFSTIDTNFTFREIYEEPIIYNDCYVSWKGMVSNLILDDKYITFDFLVGYHTLENYEGTVYCKAEISKLSAMINNGDAAEILARIKYSANSFNLEVVSYHKILPGEINQL